MAPRQQIMMTTKHSTCVSTTSTVHTDCFQKSFFPNCIKAGNNLPVLARNIESPTLFKCWLKFIMFKHKYNPLFEHGNRYTSVLHGCLRFYNSALNCHLFTKSCIPSPYFLTCPRYAAQRQLYSPLLYLF